MDFNFPPHEILKKGGGINLAKNEQLATKLEKEKKIKSEVNRIKKLFKDFPKEKIKVMESLFSESAFMKIQLEELRSYLLENGMTEIFEQGEQCFRREKPETKIYTTLIQRYSNSMKQILDYLPNEVKKNELDELAKFIAKGIKK